MNDNSTTIFDELTIANQSEKFKVTSINYFFFRNKYIEQDARYLVWVEVFQ